MEKTDVRPTSTHLEVDLDCSWPVFLDWLGRDSDKVWHGLRDFTVRALTAVPPSVFSRCRLSPEQREDVLSETVKHLCEDDFSRLRKYSDRGGPFAAWLSTVASNIAKKTYRKERRPPIPQPSPEPRITLSPRFEEAISRCTKSLSKRCQALISLDQLGYKPQAIVHLLGRELTNVQVGNALVHCRRMLAKCLHAQGYTQARWQRERG
jgi:DNA-directed RNA polymerase specialized sigma24 family protein